MLRKFAVGLVLSLFATPAMGQALCERSDTGFIGDTRCVEIGQRFWTDNNEAGFEEDSITGISTADVMLTKTQLVMLPTMRVKIADAPGENKHIWIEWIIIQKIGTTGVPVAFPTPHAVITMASATSTDGLITPGSDEAINFSALDFFAHPAPGGLPDGNYVQRTVIDSFSVGVSPADTGIAFAVVGTSGAPWAAAMANLSDDTMLRLIVRYRTLDLSVPFDPPTDTE